MSSKRKSKAKAKPKVAPARKPVRKAKPSAGIFSTDILSRRRTGRFAKARIIQQAFQRGAPEADGIALDSSIRSAYRYGGSAGVPEAQLLWYATQGFIGYQTCAMLAQNWLVDKACSVAPEDAVRNGYELSAGDGKEVTPEKWEEIKQANIAMRLDWNLEQYARFNRIFGIRVAIFVVESTDPLYYEKPFNIDGVKPGMYRGISQVDPYWMSPAFAPNAIADPANIDFYVPTWWVINGKKYHKSHLCAVSLNEVADVLKPTYFYGGISVPQKIYERAYSAERSANEAPQLLLTKRLNTLNLDLDAAAMNIDELKQKIESFNDLRDNFGTRVLGLQEVANQFDTTLSDVDEVILTQYQLVAAAAKVPVTKLMGTAPKGMDATGEYDESSYHESLKSIQTHELQPLIDGHLARLAKSMGLDFRIVATWNKLDEPTAKELAEINKIKADTDTQQVQNGAIDGQDVRNRLITDPNSGYNGLSEVPESEENGEGGVEQEVSMNGAQISSLVEVLQGVSSGTMPPETAQELIGAAFPINADIVKKMVSPMLKATPPHELEPRISDNPDSEARTGEAADPEKEDVGE
jgi:uncharacterized protein